MLKTSFKDHIKLVAQIAELHSQKHNKKVAKINFLPKIKVIAVIRDFSSTYSINRCLPAESCDTEKE